MWDTILSSHAKTINNNDNNNSKRIDMFKVRFEGAKSRQNCKGGNNFGKKWGKVHTADTKTKDTKT